jgi:hypothetical protein
LRAAAGAAFSCGLRPAVERVGALARLYLHKLAGNLKALCIRKLPERGALRFDAKAGPALLRG